MYLKKRLKIELFIVGVASIKKIIPGHTTTLKEILKSLTKKERVLIPLNAHFYHIGNNIKILQEIKYDSFIEVFDHELDLIKENAIMKNSKYFVSSPNFMNISNYNYKKHENDTPIEDLPIDDGLSHLRKIPADMIRLFRMRGYYA